jgi:hypothetical protein
MTGDPIGFETLKLLVEVAWADHEITDEEIDYLIGLARLMEVDEFQIEAVRCCLRDEGRLPAPNMVLLQAQAQDVMRCVDVLIATDGRIAADERAVRSAIEMLLGLRPAPAN